MFILPNFFQVSNYVMLFILVICILDMLKKPSTASIKSYWVEKALTKEKTVEAPFNSLKPIDLQRGDVLHLLFEVHRKKTGSIFIERHFMTVDTQDDEIRDNVLWTINKYVKATTKPIEIEADFIVPLSATEGCGHYFISKNYFTGPWNVITWIKPIMTESEKFMSVSQNKF